MQDCGISSLKKRERERLTSANGFDIEDFEFEFKVSAELSNMKAV